MNKLVALSCVLGLMTVGTYSFSAVREVHFVNGHKIIKYIDQNRPRHPAWAIREPGQRFLRDKGYYRNRPTTVKIKTPLRYGIPGFKYPFPRPVLRHADAELGLARRTPTVLETNVTRRVQQVTASAQGNILGGIERSQTLVKQVLPQLEEGEIIHSVGLADELFDIVYVQDLRVDLSAEGLNDFAAVLEKARQQNPQATFLIIQTHQPTEVFAKQKSSVEAVREKRNVIEYLFDLEDNGLFLRSEDVPELEENQVGFLLDKAR